MNGLSSQKQVLRGLLHYRIFWTPASLRRNPYDILVRILYVTGFTMDAVGEVQFQARLASCLVGFHFIDIGRTESGAGILVFLSAYSVADVKVWNPQMGWLF